MCAQRALVNCILAASDTIAGIPLVAGATEATLGVPTSSVVVAVVQAVRTLVQIRARGPIPLIALVACAREPIFGVLAGRVGIAVVCACFAFIDTGRLASGSVTLIAFVACAREPVFGVLAGRVDIAVVGTRFAFIDTGRLAGGSVTLIAFVALAREAADGVVAGSVFVAVVRAFRALVHVLAGAPIPGVPRVAFAGKAVRQVGARGVVVAIMAALFALVDQIIAAIITAGHVVRVVQVGALATVVAVAIGADPVEPTAKEHPPKAAGQLGLGDVDIRCRANIRFRSNLARASESHEGQSHCNRRTHRVTSHRSSLERR